jgi:hypothetical protein
MLTAAALGVLAYEFNSSLGLRGEIGEQHGALCCRILADPRLDSTTVLFWVYYLWVGIAIKATTFETTPTTCINIVTRLLTEVDPALPTDLKLTQEICIVGTTADFTAPSIFRFLSTRGATATVGRSVAAVACTLLVIEHHRLGIQRGASPRKAVADVLRLVDLLVVDDTEILLSAALGALFNFLSEVTSRNTDIVGDVAALAEIMRSSAAVLKAASACSPRIWCMCELVTVVARLVFNLVIASYSASEAAISAEPVASKEVEETESGVALEQKPSRLSIRDIKLGLGNKFFVLDALSYYVISVVPASGAARCSLGVQRAAQSCLEAIAAICSHSNAVDSMKRVLSALIAM